MEPKEIEQLDAYMEPKLTPSQQADKDAEEAEYQREKVEREWDGWGSSKKQLASQQAALDLLGGMEE